MLPAFEKKEPLILFTDITENDHTMDTPSLISRWQQLSSYDMN
jgi:hypothetical protein